MGINLLDPPQRSGNNENMPRPRWIGAPLLALVLAAVVLSPVYGQRFRRFFRFSDNEPPETQFIFARWEYSSGSDGWSHDYPAAEEHINQIMKEATGIHVDRMSYRIVPISSPEIFQYPFGYISEPGMMRLTEEEIKNFREFVD